MPYSKEEKGAPIVNYGSITRVAIRILSLKEISNALDEFSLREEMEDIGKKQSQDTY